VLLEESIGVVGVAVARNYAACDRLQETCHLPGCSATFRVTNQTFLCHDGDSIPGSTIKGLQVVFQIHLSFFSLAWVLVPWMKRTPISSAVRPHTARAQRRGKMRGFAPPEFCMSMPQATGGEDILLSMRSLSFKISDAAREKVVIHDFTLALAELHFLFQLTLLEGKLFSNLLAAEGDLASTAVNVEEG
jgi:hypothetical protein